MDLVGEMRNASIGTLIHMKNRSKLTKAILLHKDQQIFQLGQEVTRHILGRIYDDEFEVDTSRNGSPISGRKHFISLIQVIEAP